MTQNNLGLVLWAQGKRTAGEAGTALLAEAVAAYRQALEVRTRATLPQDWARTQKNLARAAFLLKDWSTAVDSYTNVLQLYPADEEAYQRARCPFHKYTASVCSLVSFPRKRESRRQRSRD